jgi:hypothetical protein
MFRGGWSSVIRADSVGASDDQLRHNVECLVDRPDDRRAGVPLKY